MRINGLSPQRSTASCPCYAHAHLRERARSGNSPSTLLHAPPTNSATSTHLSPASDPNLPAKLISLTPGTHIHLGSQTPRGRDAHQKPSNSQKLSAHEGTLSITTTSNPVDNASLEEMPAHQHDVHAHTTSLTFSAPHDRVRHNDSANKLRTQARQLHGIPWFH